MPKKVQISKRNTALLAALFSIAGITVSSSVTAVGTDETKSHAVGERVSHSKFFPQNHQRKVNAQIAAAPLYQSPAVESYPAPTPPVAGPIPSAAADAVAPAFSEVGGTRRLLIQPVFSISAEPLLYVSQSDSPKEPVSFVSGHGKRQRVVSVIQKIVPSGWSGFSSDDGIKEAMRVSWKEKNVPWPEALNKVLAQAKLKALINWEKREVDIMAVVEVDPVAHVQAPQEVVSHVPHVSARQAAVEVRAKPADQKPRSGMVQRGIVSHSSSGSVASPRVTMATDIKPVRGHQGASGYGVKAPPAVMLESRRTGVYGVSQVPTRLEPSQVQQKVAMLTDLDSDLKNTSAEMVGAEIDADALAKEVARAELADANAIMLQVQNNKPTSSTFSSSAPSANAQAPERYRRLKIEGSSTTRNVMVQSAGFNIPLLTALADVSPKGWLIYSKEGSFSTKMLTAWKGGNRPWLELVDEMLAAHNLTAIVRHNSREIQVIQAN